MSLAKCFSAQLIGLSINIITIEVDISNGLNAVSIVGLGDRAIEEARDRVSAAIKNSGYASPKQKNQKVVISLAPADIRKEGPSFDLAIALSYLKASKEITFDPEGVLFIGELSLEGLTRKVTGLLPILCEAPKHGFKTAYIPLDNISEARFAENITIYAVSSLQEVIDCLINGENSKIKPIKKAGDFDLGLSNDLGQTGIDMQTIRGNEIAKRGLEIAAAGAHNILMFGPPGTGKTMLAQSFKTILPPLSREESIEVIGIHSAARTLSENILSESPPFRAPHHTASYPAIVGGGAFPKPGEITLAHRGVLFLDEFPEFDRSVIEALRQPLEERQITIARARGSVTFPAQCILIASMNPCPCGKPKNDGCNCTAGTISSYKRRISGPIMDRLDIWVNVNKVDYEKLSAKSSTAETSLEIRNRVIAARAVQRSRFTKFCLNKKFNSEMDAVDIEKIVSMTDEARKTLSISAEKLKLSGRAFHRIIKIAQTIRDLSQKSTSAVTQIENLDILEALQYRQKIEDS